MAARPDSLPGRLYLLAYDLDRGKVAGKRLGELLRAGAVADLHLTGCLIDERGKVVVRAGASVTDPVLAGVLAEIGDHGRPRSWKRWLRRRVRPTKDAVARQLADDGFVKLEQRRALGVFPYLKVTVRDPRVVKGLVTSLRGTLRAPVSRIEPRDMVLVALVAAAELRTVLPRAVRREHKAKLKELITLSGPVAPALRSLIREQNAAVASGG